MLSNQFTFSALFSERLGLFAAALGSLIPVSSYNFEFHLFRMHPFSTPWKHQKTARYIEYIEYIVNKWVNKDVFFIGIKSYMYQCFVYMFNMFNLYMVTIFFFCFVLFLFFLFFEFSCFLLGSRGIMALKFSNLGKISHLPELWHTYCLLITVNGTTEGLAYVRFSLGIISLFSLGIISLNQIQSSRGLL